MSGNFSEMMDGIMTNLDVVDQMLTEMHAFHIHPDDLRDLIWEASVNTVHLKQLCKDIVRKANV